MESGRLPNRLIREKSPYLLQHAYNPVDWYPWCDEAFEKARREDKPIFLSIGYSTCHWCHVMEKESFEDPEVARLLNETFVCIKVDREERPDLDAVYMEVCQLMTGGGGWPLTIIMTPDGKPFFAATYIPKRSRFGMPGLLDLIPKIRDAWLNNRKELLEVSEGVLEALKRGGVGGGGGVDGRRALEGAYQRLYEEFDETHGGFGVQPKFPMAHRLNFLLRRYRRTGDKGALFMVEKTLQRIRFGGIFDQVGFGVHRYSTDQRWMVPHFEKMLYDQAALSIAYLEAYQATGKPFYLGCAREIFEFTLRELGSKDGGFFSALDADSEGVEGKYYLWGWGELENILSAEELRVVAEYYNVSRDGNLGEEFGGMNILHAEVGVEDYAAERGLDPNLVRAVLEGARRKLFEARGRRVRPSRDEKVLADHNGYMVAALARGASITGSNSYLEAAERAAHLILSKMGSPDGGLYHVYAGGEAYVQGLLNDYAYVVWGLVELYEATFKPEYLREALRLNDYMLKHFWDDAAGGFYMVPDNAGDVPVRPKELYDGAIPSGNSVAFTNLVVLSRMTGRTTLEEFANRALEAVGPQLERNPEGFTHLLCGLDLALGPSYEVVVVGGRGSGGVADILGALRSRFLPNCVLVLRDPADPEIAELCPYTKDMGAGGGGRPLVYVCSNFSCNMPTGDVGEVLRLLGV